MNTNHFEKIRHKKKRDDGCLGGHPDETPENREPLQETLQEAEELEFYRGELHRCFHINGDRVIITRVMGIDDLYSPIVLFSLHWSYDIDNNVNCSILWFQPCATLRSEGPFTPAWPFNDLSLIHI